MPLLYGERERAFVRLQEETLENSDDQSIYAWEDQCQDGDELLVDTGDVLLRGPFARSPAEFSYSGAFLCIEVPLHRLRHSTGRAPLYLADLACYYEGDFTESLGICIRPLIVDRFARDHGKRAPVVLDPKLNYSPVRSVIYLCKDAPPSTSEDFDRHHEFLVHLLPPEYGFKVPYVFPKEQWMRIKGNSAIFLNPGQYAAVVFKHKDERQISVLMSHESMTNKLYESYGFNKWGLDKCRCRIFIYDSVLGFYIDESLGSMKGDLKYEGARAARFQNDIEGGCEKTIATMQDGAYAVAEMKKETIMGERMIVVNVKINASLFHLSGISSINNIPAHIQQPVVPLQDSLPPPLENAIPPGPPGPAPHNQVAQQPFQTSGSGTSQQPGQLQGFPISMPGGHQGFLLLQQSLQQPFT